MERFYWRSGWANGVQWIRSLGRFRWGGCWRRVDERGEVNGKAGEMEIGENWEGCCQCGRRRVEGWKWNGLALREKGVDERDVARVRGGRRRALWLVEWSGRGVLEEGTDERLCVSVSGGAFLRCGKSTREEWLTSGVYTNTTWVKWWRYSEMWKEYKRWMTNKRCVQ